MVGNEHHQKNVKVNELESIRGLAALLVVFLHIPIWNSVLEIGIIRNSYLMVELFFVLSGYVICNAYASNINNIKQLFRFQFLRFGRLYPIHLFFLSIYLSIELARYIYVTQFNGVVDVAPFEKNSVMAFIEHLFLLQSLGITEFGFSDLHGTYNVPAWSISVEFYTYLLFGLMVLFATKIKQIFFLVIFLLSVILLVTHVFEGAVLLLRCTAGFFLGCLISELAKISRFTLPTYLSVISFLSIVTFLEIKPLFEFDVGIYFLTAILIFTLVKSEIGVLKKILNWKALVWLGTISYSVYMSHYFIIRIFDVIMRRVIKLPLHTGINGSIEVQLTFLETTIASVSVVAIVLLLSHLTYTFIEAPMRLKSRSAV